MKVQLKLPIGMENFKRIRTDKFRLVNIKPALFP